MCLKCRQRNLATLTVVAERELDQGGNIPEFLRRLTSIRTDMQELGGMAGNVYEIENIIAEFQPYLMKPFFIEQ